MLQYRGASLRAYSSCGNKILKVDAFYSNICFIDSVSFIEDAHGVEFQHNYFSTWDTKSHQVSHQRPVNQLYCVEELIVSTK